jgi:hypothetical protein
MLCLAVIRQTAFYKLVDILFYGLHERKWFKIPVATILLMARYLAIVG